jgi:hypothetical protein
MGDIIAQKRKNASGRAKYFIFPGKGRGNGREKETGRL